MEIKKQAAAPPAWQLGEEAFSPDSKETTIYWLGNAGVFINSHGTCIMLDPYLDDFRIPPLIRTPIRPEEVPRLDGVLITHCDDDHYSVSTCRRLNGVCRSFHTTRYVAQLLEEEGITGGIGHDIGDKFSIGFIQTELTRVDHTWQNEAPACTRVFQQEDACGFYLHTPEGTVWIIGDSRLLAEQLRLPKPDMIFLDFSDDSWHIGLENAVKLANHYQDSKLVLTHWGSLDAPDVPAFNPDPAKLDGRIINPERVCLVAPGEPIYF